MAIHKLQDSQIRNAVCTTKTVRKMSDGGGLYLWIYADGRRYWRYRYLIDGREQALSVGTYPEVSLAEARDKAAELRKQDDPAKLRKAEKQADSATRANTFESVARQWHTKHKAHWVAKHAHDLLSQLDRYVFPLIGKRPINELGSADVLDVLEKIEDAGAVATAHRMLAIFGRIFRYGKAKGLCQHVVSSDISGRDSLQKAVTKKHPAVTDKELPQLLRKIDAYESRQTRLALKMIFLTFVRANEMLGATWTEIDLDDCLWRIPEERMKKRLALLVPLAPQTIEILRELKEISCGSEYVFPGRSYEKPLHSGTLLSALKTLGYHGTQTSHGVRRLASTAINNAADEEGRPLFSGDSVERQLAHVPETVRNVYNEAEYLPMRRRIMVWWADYLDAAIKKQ
ncbi:integrase arm-type DNA-binding domain-containing protein [Pseudomonas sp. R5(2019)]|uniref:tyrosine-type recombinase/integrase n=1 Tax=Pseudomonas sp. R5(2019) TaxID=2697566 RepID=UPI0014136F79|nr:integrase arm-type DNA-binding domain-containing protein [Pseudomonas sp. R5(2019)]NBA93444.1 tyrosine-type recombinase/integrase [Pseudomonas sp. R5(2019)]